MLFVLVFVCKKTNNKNDVFILAILVFVKFIVILNTKKLTIQQVHLKNYVTKKMFEKPCSLQTATVMARTHDIH